MNKVDNVIQNLITFGFPIEVARKIKKELEQEKLTEEQQEMLQKYSAQITWLICLEIYSKSLIIPALINNILRMCSLEFEDFILKQEMQNFLNIPTYEKGEKLYHKISNNIPKDVINDLSKMLLKLQTKFRDLEWIKVTF